MITAQPPRSRNVNILFNLSSISFSPLYYSIHKDKRQEGVNRVNYSLIYYRLPPVSFVHLVLYHETHPLVKDLCYISSP